MVPSLRWLQHANRKVFIPFALCVGFAALVAVLYWFRFGSENGSLGDLDGYQLNRNVQLGKRAPADSRLVFLAIDRNSYRDAIGPDEVGGSDTLEALRGTYPWSRKVWADVIERLMAAHARIIVIDLLFPAPREGDDQLKAVIEKYSDRIVIGSNFQEDKVLTDGHESNVVRVMLPSPSLLGTPEHPQVTGQDPRVGFVNMWPDDDGVIRKTYFYRNLEIEMGQKPQGLPRGNPQAMSSLVGRVMQELHVEDDLPNSWAGQVIRYAGPPNLIFLPRSLYEIFIPSLWAGNCKNGEIFRDKIVLIGPAGNWVQDEHKTPYPELMPGPEIHLSVLSAALQKAYLRETGRFTSLVMIICAGFLAFLWVFFVRNPYYQIILGVASVVTFFLVSLGCYNYLDFYLPVATPSVSFFGGLVLAFVYQIVREQYERSRLRGVLDRYMSKDLVKDVLDNPNSFFNTVGGVRKPVSVLFSDVRGFTTISEGADPGDLVKQLNEYLGEMVKIVFHNQGTLDKFIGDAVMAVWGNVVTGGENVDACRAVRTALEMRAGLAKLNADWRTRAMMELAFGIGINHGEVIVGNVGSEQKMEITVIGDAVNLASRLESLTKEYQLDLLIGERVAELVEAEFYLQMADHVRVKGKNKPIRTFTVLSERGPSPDVTMDDFLQYYQKAMGYYQNADFVEALKFFELAHALLKPNSLTRIYIDRCHHLIGHPPEEWTGVYVMTKK